MVFPSVISVTSVAEKRKRLSRCVLFRRLKPLSVRIAEIRYISHRVHRDHREEEIFLYNYFSGLTNVQEIILAGGIWRPLHAPQSPCGFLNFTYNRRTRYMTFMYITNVDSQRKSEGLGSDQHE